MNITRIQEKEEKYAEMKKAYDDKFNDLTRDHKVMSKEQLAQDEAEYNEIETLANEIETLKREERRNALSTINNQSSVSSPAIVRSSRQTATKADANNAMKAWLANGVGAVNVREDWKRSSDLLGSDYTANEWFIRDQTSDVNAEGKYLMNDSVFHSMDTARSAFGGLENVAHKIETSNGNPIHIGKTNDVSNSGSVRLQAEDVTAAAVTHARTSLGCFSYAAEVASISYELIQDSSFDIQAYIGELLGERIARAYADDLVDGAGTAGCRGILQDTTQGTTALSTGIDEDDLYDMYFSIDKAYRKSPSCAWVMNDNTLATLLKNLTDSNGQPIWGSGLREAPGTQILGKQVVIDNCMPSAVVATEKTPIIFGDMSKFKIRTVGPVQVEKENNPKALCVNLYAWIRMDSGLVDSGTNPVKHLTTGTISGDA